MKNKIKLIDRLKSWLVTLGVASVFGLAALGVNAAKSYEKASAYVYEQNGTLYLHLLDEVHSYSPLFDLSIFYNYLSYFDDNSSDYYLELSFIVNDDNGGTITLDNHFLAEDWSVNAEGRWYFQFLDEYEDSLEMYVTSDSAFVNYSPEGIDACEVAYVYVLPSYQGYQQLRNYALSYNPPQNSGNFITALTSFMSLLGGAIVQLATPVASGVTSFASALFIDNSHLSIMGGIIGIFAGIALAVGITSKVYAWVSTLGN